MNPQVAAGGNAAATANPTPISLATPSNNQVYRAASGGGLYSVQNGVLYMTSSADPSVSKALQTAGVDINSIPTLGDSTLADMNRNGIYSSVQSIGATDPNLSKYFSPTSATTQMQTVNTQSATPASPTTIAAAQAAQTQQLAGDQGQNVTQTTTPEGIAAVQKTPLGTPAAQTQTTSGVSTQTPSTAGAAAGAPINYAKSPTETIDQYNARIAASGGPVAPSSTSTGAASTVDTNYQMQPGETIDSYNARIAAYNAQKPTTSPTGQVGSSGTMAQTQTATGAPDPYAGLDPIAKQVKMYTDAYNALGLNTIKQQFDDYTKQQSDLTNEMNDKIANTVNNPWLSQGVSDKTVQRIKDSYATKLDTLTNLLTLTDSLYKQGQAQVDTMVSAANADIKATNDLAQQQIDAANALAKDNSVHSELVNGVPHDLLINNETGKTVADLGPSASTANQTSTDVVSVGGRQKLINKQTGQVIADLGPVTQTANQSAGLSADAQALLAQSFLNTGSLPALGNGASGTRTNILNQAGQLAAQQGISGNDLASQQASYKANAASLSELQTQASQVQAFESTANANLDVVNSLATQTASNGLPVFNAWLQAGRTATGDANVSKYNAAIQTAVNEYARVVSSVTGGGTTSDSARAEIQGLLNNAQTPSQVASVIQLMKTDMANRQTGYTQQIQSLQSQLSNPYSSGTTSSGSAPSSDQTQAILNQFF